MPPRPFSAWPRSKQPGVSDHLHKVNCGKRVGRRPLFTLQVTNGTAVTAVVTDMMDRAGRPILIVEDHSLLRTALTTTLELSGYPVMAASNEREALQRIEQCPPSLVVLDFLGPTPSFTRFAQELEARGYDPPIVVLTEAPGDLSPLPQAPGAVGRLAMPFDYNALLAAVEQFRIP